MFRRLKKLYLTLSIVFLFILFSSFVFFNNHIGAKQQTENDVVVVVEKPVIKKDTIIQQEIKYLCGDRMVSTIPTTNDLVGLDYEGLLAHFPPGEGWAIDDTIPNFLTISRTEKSICSVHQDYYHLGSYENKLAVYKGPIGYKDELVKVEDVSLDKLPDELQADLKLVAEYNSQTLEDKNRLKTHLEFDSEENLEKMLLKLWDELDEML